jgi:plasmid stabilization system protein ParE
MNYRVVITHRARRDARLIAEWIAERSGSGAAAWSAALDRALRLLSSSPERHSIAPEADESTLPLRQFLFKTRRGRVYRGLFTVTEDVVLVLHIRGPGQDLVRPEDFEN